MGHELLLQKAVATKHDCLRFPNANIVLINLLRRRSRGTHGGLHRRFTEPRQNSCLFFPCCLGNIILLGRRRTCAHSWDGNPLVKLHNWKCKHIQEQDVTKALRNMNKSSDRVCPKLLSCYMLFQLFKGSGGGWALRSTNASKQHSHVMQYH